LKSSKTPFTRSSSFHSSLRHSKTNKTEQNIFCTKSNSPTDISPIKTNGIILKRSKSAKEITSRSSKSNKTSLSSSSLIIPFINQCLQPEKTPIHIKPPKRPPPPIPPKASPCISNHIYDSLQDSPIQTNKKDNRTVYVPRLLSTRVTEL